MVSQIVRAAELLRMAKGSDARKTDIFKRAHAELAALNVSLSTSEKDGKLFVHIAKKTSELSLDDVARLLEALVAKRAYKQDVQGFDVFADAANVKRILDRCIAELPVTDADTADLRAKYNRLKADLDAKRITIKQFWNELMPELVAALRAQSELKKESRLLEDWANGKVDGPEEWKQAAREELAKNNVEWTRRIYPFLYMKAKWPDVDEKQQIRELIVEIRGAELKQFLDAYAAQIKARYPDLSDDIDNLMGRRRRTTLEVHPPPPPSAIVVTPTASAPASITVTPPTSLASPPAVKPAPVALALRPPSVSDPVETDDAGMRLALDRAKRNLGSDYQPNFDAFFRVAWKSGKRDAEEIVVDYLDTLKPTQTLPFEELKAEWLRILPVGAKGEHMTIALSMASKGEKPNNSTPYGQLRLMLTSIDESQRELLSAYIERHFGGAQAEDGEVGADLHKRIFAQVKFSSEAEAVIRSAGFEPSDVPKIMLKGFHIHGSKRALGGATFEESIIRRNLRNADFDPDKVLAFLDRYDLLNRKKEGISINNTPTNVIGVNIMHVVNTQVIAKLQGANGGTVENDLSTEISNVRFSDELARELNGTGFTVQNVATMLLSVFRLHSAKAAVQNRGMDRNIIVENLRKNGLDSDRALRFLARVDLLSEGQRTYSIKLRPDNDIGRRILAELHPVIERLKGRPERHVEA